MVRSADDAIIGKTITGVVQTWNPAAERLYGYRAEDMIGRDTTILLPPDRSDEEAVILDRIAQGERVDHFDTVRRRQDGQLINVSVSISPIMGKNNLVIGAFHVARDITASAELEFARGRLAAIVESSEDAIISKDLKGIVQTWNKSAQRIYGYSLVEMVGRSMSLLLPPDRPDEENTILERLAKGQRVDHFETARIRKDGARINVSLSISPVYDREGSVVAASHVARDITERQHMELQRLHGQKLESLGVLTSGIAHDFNNLLCGILSGVSFAIANLPANHPSFRSLALAERACEKAADLTHQMLAYAGKGKFVVTRFDLSVLIRDMLTLLQSSIPKLVKLDLALDPALPWIEADASQIQQVVMNLVINGAESMVPDGGILRVTTRAMPAKKSAGVEVCMEVRDSGSGMTDETLARIFDPFFTTKVTGRGLGLAAVSGIVRAHEGRMQVESAVGRGSTFRTYFPGVERRVIAQEVPAVLSSLLAVGTVLVVDDEPALRTLAKMILEKCGYTVLLAGDGQGAVEVFRQHADAITAILLDMTMPVMNGEEAFRLLRMIRADVPIVISTGYSEVATRELFADGAVVGFIQKPYTAARLTERIRTTLQAVKIAEPSEITSLAARPPTEIRRDQSPR